jgi:hypothetical protein
MGYVSNGQQPRDAVVPLLRVERLDTLTAEGQLWVAFHIKEVGERRCFSRGGFS